jgi:hypothetical protein
MAVRIAIEPLPNVRLTSDAEADIGATSFYDISADLGDTSPPCRYVAIAGNAQKTVVANYHDGAETIAREEQTAGDGTVPLWSAAPPGIPVRYVSATHSDDFKDADTIATLHAVLKPGTPGGRLFSLEQGPAMLVPQVICSSVAPGAQFTVAIVADRRTQTVDATVEVTFVLDDERKHIDVVSIRYQGGPIRSIPLEFIAPNERAAALFTVRPNVGTASDKPASVLVVS